MQKEQQPLRIPSTLSLLFPYADIVLALQCVNLASMNYISKNSFSLYFQLKTFAQYCIVEVTQHSDCFCLA